MSKLPREITTTTSKNSPSLTQSARLELIEIIDNQLRESGKFASEKSVKYVIDEFVDWENLPLTSELKAYTFDELKAEYNQIRTSCRLFKTYSELFEDIKKAAADVTTFSRPINAYARFVRERMIQMDKAGVETKGRFGTIANEWKELAESSKRKYLDAFELELKEWKRIYKNTGDDKHSVVKTTKTPGPKIPLKPIELFCNKYKDDVHEDTDLQELKNKFFKLKRSKLLSYIKAAMSCLEDYRQRAKDYLEENPDFVDKCKYKTARYPLSIREFNLWMENYLDAPARPQNSAKEQYAHDEDLTMLEASDYWKSLSRKQKDTKNIVYKDKQRKYALDYVAWYEKQDDFIQEELAISGFAPKKPEIDSNDSELETVEVDERPSWEKEYAKEGMHAKSPTQYLLKTGKALPVLTSVGKRSASTARLNAKKASSPQKFAKSKAIVEDSESDVGGEEEPEVEPEVVAEVMAEPVKVVEEEEEEEMEDIPSPPKKKKKSKDGKKSKKSKKEKKKKHQSDSDNE